jgi:nicotinate-nucleotide pyrophosphorylase (carboxylating)
MDALHKSIVDLVRVALEEDIGRGDLTSLACLEPDPAQGRITAKSDGILSGVEPALLVFEKVDSANKIDFLISDGDSFSRGDTIARVDGFNQTLLASERVALNFLGHLSGIATMTGLFVACLAGTGCRVLDTRKTTPGWRYLEKRAVVHGGGLNHRLGLYDMVLIKDNHIASVGSIAVAVKAVREFMQTGDFRLQFDTEASTVLIEVEVTNEEQVTQAIESGVDRLLLDNQNEESLRTLVNLARELDPKVLLEASGNINLENANRMAATGVDFISVGTITHSSPVSDLSLTLDPQNG